MNLFFPVLVVVGVGVLGFIIQYSRVHAPGTRPLYNISSSSPSLRGDPPPPSVEYTSVAIANNNDTATLIKSECKDDETDVGIIFCTHVQRASTDQSREERCNKPLDSTTDDDKNHNASKVKHVCPESCGLCGGKETSKTSYDDDLAPDATDELKTMLIETKNEILSYHEALERKMTDRYDRVEAKLSNVLSEMKTEIKSELLKRDAGNPELPLAKLERMPSLLSVREPIQRTGDKATKHDSDTTTEENNHHHLPPCTIQPHPVPMILMSLGRSGTTAILEVLSTLTNEKHDMTEFTGSNLQQSYEFFKQIPDDDIYGDWLVKFMCHEQQQHPNAGIVGFKWKPFDTIFTEPKAIQGLKCLGRSDAPSSPIRVIRSRRNALDVVISW